MPRHAETEMIAPIANDFAPPLLNGSTEPDLAAEPHPLDIEHFGRGGSDTRNQPGSANRRPR